MLWKENNFFVDLKQSFGKIKTLGDEIYEPKLVSSKYLKNITQLLSQICLPLCMLMK